MSGLDLLALLKNFTGAITRLLKNMSFQCPNLLVTCSTPHSFAHLSFTLIPELTFSTRRVSHARQEMLTLPEHPVSLPVFLLVVRVSQICLFFYFTGHFLSPTRWYFCLITTTGLMSLLVEFHFPEDITYPVAFILNLCRKVQTTR